MRGDLSPLLSIMALMKVAYGESELIDEDVIDDVTTVFVFKLKDSAKYVTVSVGLTDVIFIES